MRRRLIPLGVVVLGLLVGAAVAGLPTTVASDVEANAIPTIDSTTTTALTPTTTAPTTTAPPTTAPPTTVAPTTVAPTPSPSTSTTAATSSAPPATTSPSTATSTPSSAATTVSGVPLSAPPVAAVPEAGNDVRIIVGNATGRESLATWVASELRTLGYTDVLPDDATDIRETSVVLYAPGFEGEARRLAAHRGVLDVRPVPRDRLTRRNEDSDLWLLVGTD